MTNFLSKRNIIGGFLCLVLVGEVTVGASNGLFTPAGFVVLSFLYFLYFILLDSIVSKYQLNNLGLLLVNFALYAVLITGLLHGELSDYALHPEDSLITTLIRIQCSFFPLFAYYLLNRVAPKRKTVQSLWPSVVLFTLFILIISPAGSFGLSKLVNTFTTAPLISVIYSIVALVAFAVAVRMTKSKGQYHSRFFGITAVCLLLIGLVPSIVTFLLLMVSMIVVGIIYIFKAEFRRAAVVKN